MLEDLEPPHKTTTRPKTGTESYSFIYNRGYDDASFVIREHLLHEIYEAIADTKRTKEEIHNLLMIYSRVVKLTQKGRNDEKQ